MRMSKLCEVNYNSMSKEIKPEELDKWEDGDKYRVSDMHVVITLNITKGSVHTHADTLPAYLL